MSKRESDGHTNQEVAADAAVDVEFLVHRATSIAKSVLHHPVNHFSANV